MFCNKCGKSISDDSLFCNYCGAKVSVPAKPEKKSAASSCKERIAEWSEKHADFLSENSLELISVFKNNIAIAKSTEKLYSENQKPKYYAIKGEENPQILSEAELIKKYRENANENIIMFHYEYEERWETYFLMNKSGFVYTESSIHGNYILTDDFLIADRIVLWDNGKKTTNVCHSLFSVKEEKELLADFALQDTKSYKECNAFAFIPGMNKIEKYDEYRVLGGKFYYRGIILPDGRVLKPDKNTGYSCDGFSKNGQSYIFRLTNFKDIKTGKALTALVDRSIDCSYTLEYLDLSGKCLAKFDNVLRVYTEHLDYAKAGYDVITTVKKQYNKDDDEYENVYTHILVDHNTLKSIEAYTDVKSDFADYNLAEYNGVTCPYVSNDDLTRLYNTKLELLTEILGRIEYTFTANHKLYSVNEIRDNRMGLDFTAVYNVNDDEECFRANHYKDFEILYGREQRFRFFVNGYQQDFQNSPFIIKHNGRQKVLFVCSKIGSGHGLVDLEGNVVVPFEYRWIDVAYENQQSGVYQLALPKNHIYMGKFDDCQQTSLCDPDGNFIIKDLEKNDFDRKVEELFPECRKSE